MGAKGDERKRVGEGPREPNSCVPSLEGGLGTAPERTASMDHGEGSLYRRRPSSLRSGLGLPRGAPSTRRRGGFKRRMAPRDGLRLSDGRARPADASHTPVGQIGAELGGMARPSRNRFSDPYRQEAERNFERVKKGR